MSERGEGRGEGIVGWTGGCIVEWDGMEWDEMGWDMNKGQDE